ncbi:MAG: 50S ribosomal protein L28 [Candidatus Andersenbacteria bacterium]|nr:50S ribosomal protein L28 [Candidatus Andersenbacteria bacterium]MBI3251030.1 50S ribosomal protein L28 [Candidatus Andersenbacteria bacterium]
MARICEICGKGPSVGNQRKLLRGHYNVTAKRRFRPNLQKTKYQGRRILACVSCIKTNSRKATLTKVSA